MKDPCWNSYFILIKYNELFHKWTKYTENMGRPNINVHFKTNLFEHFCVFQNNLNF